MTIPRTHIFTHEDLVKVYDELDRRMAMDIEDGTVPCRYIEEERKARLQGLYGTIMALASNKEWQQIVWWIDEIEEERYYPEGKYDDQGCLKV